MPLDFPFDVHSKEDWLEKIQTDLKGKSMTELDWVISDDIKMSPFAHLDKVNPEFSPLGSSESNTWLIIEAFVVDNNESEINKLALHALGAGVTALSFTIKGETCDFESLCKEIQLEWIHIHLDCSSSVVEQFFMFLQQTEFDPRKIQGSLQLDLASDLSLIPSKFERIKVFQCSATTEEDISSELAQLLLQAQKFIEGSTEQIGEKLYFELTLGDSFYQNICKIRALKNLWLLMMEAYDMSANLAFIQARMTTHSHGEDADYLKIKVAAQAISAVIGGVSMLHLPPTQVAERQDFHTRISRNVHHLLQLESFMDRVSDPAAGSYYIESLTDVIAEAAWKKFQEKQQERS